MFQGKSLILIDNARGLDEATLRELAREFNVPTVFVVPAKVKSNHDRLRFFMPSGEVEFIAHAVVGLAIHRARFGGIGIIKNGDSRNFEFGAENLVATVRYTLKEGQVLLGDMKSPYKPAFHEVKLSKAEVADVLSLDEVDIGAELSGVTIGENFILVPISDIQALKEIKVNRQKLPEGASLYCYTPTGAKKFRVRKFSRAEPLEDSASGSGALALAAHLGNQLTETDRTQWTIFQGDEVGRPSRLDIAAQKRGTLDVYVAGNCINLSLGQVLSLMKRPQVEN